MHIVYTYVAHMLEMYTLCENLTLIHFEKKIVYYNIFHRRHYVLHKSTVLNVQSPFHIYTLIR